MLRRLTRAVIALLSNASLRVGLSVKARRRRLFFEQFEDRRLLAIASDDNFTIGINEQTTQDAWANDTYNSSWDSTEHFNWGCINWDAINGEPVCIEEGWVPETESVSGWFVEGQLPTNGTVVSWSPPVYAPSADFVGTDSFAYYVCDDQGCGMGIITVNVVDNRDIEINGFTTDGTDLQVAYSVSGVILPFSITLYASPDGETLDYALQSVPADNTIGTHTLTIPASFDDLPEDYYLLAVVDGLNEVPEIDEDNNSLVFTSGAFAVTEPGTGDVILHVAPEDVDDTADAITISEGPNNTLQIITRDAADPTLFSQPEGDPQGLFYDVTGDAKVNTGYPTTGAIVSQLDVDVLMYNLAHTERPWQNPTNRWDVTGDGYLAPDDLSSIINYINSVGAELLDRSKDPAFGFLDVNGDNAVSWNDYYQVKHKFYGGSGDFASPWQNPNNSRDVNNDGIADIADAQALIAYLDGLFGTPTSFPLDDIDGVAIRTHGGDDTIVSTIVNSDFQLRIYAGDDNDLIQTGPANDIVSGDNGDDTIITSAGNDTIYAGDGTDFIDTGLGNDTIDAGTGNDMIHGGSGDDSIDGADGDDVLDGGVGNDVISGASGNNVIQGGDGNDTVFGGSGNDTIDGGAGNDTIDGGTGNDTIDGGDGDDTISGGEGDDTLNGGAGSDSVFGGAGNNTGNAGGQAGDSYDPSGNPVGTSGGNGVEDGSVTVTLPSSSNEGDSVSAYVAISRPGAVIASVDIDWGDGYGEPITMAAQNGSPIPHTFDFDSIGIDPGQEYVVWAFAHWEDGVTTKGHATITVENVAPTATDDATTTNRNADITLNVLMNDTDPSWHDQDNLHIVSVDSSMTLGYVSFDPNGDGDVFYNPNGMFNSLGPGQSATDTFTYVVADPLGATDTGTVTVTVTGELDTYRLDYWIEGIAKEDGSVAADLVLHLDQPAITAITVTWGPLYLPGDSNEPYDWAVTGDVTNSSGSTTIPAGTQEVRVPLTPVDDAIVEKTEKMRIQLPVAFQTATYFVRTNGDEGNGLFTILHIVDDEWRWETVPSMEKPSGDYSRTVYAFEDSIFGIANHPITRMTSILRLRYEAGKDRILPQSPLDGQNTITVMAKGTFLDNVGILESSLVEYPALKKRDFSFDYDPETGIITPQQSGGPTSTNSNGDLKVAVAGSVPIMNHDDPNVHTVTMYVTGGIGVGGAYYFGGGASYGQVSVSFSTETSWGAHREFDTLVVLKLIRGSGS